jgi:hypothetical protein
MSTTRVPALVAQCSVVLREYPCESSLQFPCEYCIRTRGHERPRRSFGSNSLDGTIPAALSALKLLSYLCVRRAAQRERRAAAAQHRSC